MPPAVSTAVEEITARTNAPGFAPPVVRAPGGEPAARQSGGELRRLEVGPVIPGRARPRRHPGPALLSFLLLVILPTALAAVYYLLIASDQYVAELRFGLRTAEPPRAETAAGLPGGGPSIQSAVDSYAVAQYIASRAAVEDVGESLDLHRIFATPAGDWPARLHLPASAEELVAYWRRQVDAFFDPTNGTIIVRVRAFAPGDALQLARAVLAASEKLVNNLSARARRDALRDSEADVVTAEHRLGAALARLRNYRDSEGLIDPHKTADANTALAARLHDELALAETQLTTLKRFLGDEAPALKLLTARIAGLKAQESQVEGEAVTTARTHDQPLSRQLGSYEELESERHFAETAYQHALEALDRARIIAERQQVYLAAFVPPSMPEEARYPRRWQMVGIVFAAACVIWAIAGLIVQSVRDHL